MRFSAIATILVAAVAGGGAQAQVVDQARGRDQSIDHASLTRFGPWDARNYDLTAADLELLAENEQEQRIAIPAFHRVELRRKSPAMRKSGPAQYPRSALRRFFTMYGGYLAVAIHPGNPNFFIAGSNGPLAGQKMNYSADGGMTWSETVPLVGSTCCNPAAAPTSDPAANHARIQLAFSRNGGASWTVVTPHDTEDAATPDRWHPWLAIGSDGTVHLAFYDTRNFPDLTGVDLFYTRSTDGGQTCIAPRRLSSVQSPNVSDALEFGDYNGLDVFQNDVIGIFTDNRAEGTPAGDSRDVYAAGVVACTAADHVTISSEVLGASQAEDRRACDTLTADPDVEIAAGFPVRFPAQRRVVLGQGFSVAVGADFGVELNRALTAE